MGFRRTVEDFVCDNCGAGNEGDGYTNHCARCLYSKHVDVEPGDRAATCHGLMTPVEVHVRCGGWTLLHRCQDCGYEHRCRAAARDDFAALLAVAEARARRDPGGGHERTWASGNDSSIPAQRRRPSRDTGR